MNLDIFSPASKANVYKNRIRPRYTRTVTKWMLSMLSMSNQTLSIFNKNSKTTSIFWLMLSSRVAVVVDLSFSLLCVNNIKIMKENHRTRKQEVHIVLPPDGGYAWVIVFASFMVNFVIDGIIYSFGNMMVILAEDLNTTVTNMSIVGCAQMGLYYLCGPFTSAFVNRFGFRIVVFTGAVITTIGILAASYFTSFLGIAICFGLLGGLGFGIMFPPSIIIIGYYFEKYRAVAVGIALVGSSAGILCLAPLFKYITTNYGWQTTMKAQAVSLSICMLSSIAYRQLKATKVFISVSDEHIIARSSVDSHVEFVQLYEYADETAKNLRESIMDKNSSTSFRPSDISKKSSYDLKRKTKECCDSLIRILFCKCFSNELTSNAITTGPLDRKDIFYTASLMLLPEYRADKEKQITTTEKSLSYHLSMIHVGSMESRNIRDQSCGKCNVSHKIINALQRLFDVSILKSVPFCIFSLANFFYVFALYIPYMFIRKKASENNIKIEYSDWFIPAMAIGNGIGRGSSGAICSLMPTINKCYLVGFPSIFAGIITIFSAFVLGDNEYYQFVFCILMGFSIAFNATMRAVVIVYLLGLEKLTNAFGLNMMMMGSAALLGFPVATEISDATGTYTYAFLLAGISFTISGVFVILAFYTHKWSEGESEKLLKNSTGH